MKHRQNRNNTSNPKLAAKQGLLKMKALADMGMKQGVLARMSVHMFQCYAV